MALYLDPIEMTVQYAQKTTLIFGYYYNLII